MIRAVVFDCDGVLSDNGSSWQMIQTELGKMGGTQGTSEMFLDGKISEEEFVAHDIKLWRGFVQRSIGMTSCVATAG